MNTKNKKVYASLTIISIAIVSVFVVFVKPGSSTTTSIIQVSPDFQFYEIGDSFTIGVYCMPTEPVKSFEFKIRFNQTALQANEVTEGNFFGSYPTFFTPAAIIDNVNGTIINIYGLILGPGNINAPGTLVNIRFTVLNVTGVSAIEIYDEGITNETEYLPLHKLDAAVQVFGIYPPWDVNKDHVTNAQDISILLGHYGETCDPPGSQPWDVRADGVCNILDVSCITNHYGESTQTLIPQDDVRSIHH